MLRRGGVPYSFALLLMLLFINTAKAQDLNVKTYTVMEGLPSSTVNGIAQDGYGRLWFATRSGIAVYDGIEWTTYSKNNGLGINEFTAIASDGAGRIWAVSKSSSVQIALFTGNSFKILKSPNFKELVSEVESNYSFAVYTNGNNSTALISVEKGNIVVYNNGSWQIINVDRWVKAGEVRDIKEAGGLFYILTSNGILLYDPNAGMKIFNSNIPQNEIPLISRMYVDFKDAGKNINIWVLGSNFIGRLSGGKYSKVVKYLDEGKAYPTDRDCFYPDYHGLFFFGNQRKTSLYSERSGKITYLSALQHSNFSGFNGALRDREDNLWIAGNRGVQKLTIPKFTSFTSQSGLFKDEVTAVTQLGNSILFGHEGGFTFYTDGKFEIKTIENSRRREDGFRIMEFAGDREGNVWFAASKEGLGIMDKNRRIKWITLPGEPLFNVVSVITDSAGDIFAATNYNIYKIVDGKPEKIKIAPLENTGYIRRIFMGNKGELCVATMGAGLFIGNEKNGFKNYTNKETPGANNIYCGSVIENNIFIGTLNGVYKVAGDSLAKCNAVEVNRPVFFIHKEGGNIWVGTDYGVIRKEGASQVNYTPHENLAGIETNRGAFFKDSRGNIWIGTDKGVSRYIEPTGKEKIYKPNLIVSFFGRDQQTLPSKDKIEIEFNHNEFTVNVDVISFIDEEQNTYIAKLENFDTDWLPETKSREKLRYTNLPPGTYRLRIKGKNASGVWSSEYVSPEIIVLTPVYRRWWFIALLAIPSIFFGYLIADYFTRRKYTSRLEKEVEERTTDLKESEIKYRNLVNNIHDGVYVVSEGVVRLANKSMAELLGYDSVNDLLGKSWVEFAYEEDLLMLSKRNKQRLKGEDIGDQVELRLKHKSGKILNVIATATLSIYEDSPAISGTIKDVTELKSQEAELRKLFTAVDQSPSSVIITDPSGVIEYVNPVFEKLTGYAKDEITGKKSSVLKSGKMPDNIYKELWMTISGGNIWRGELLNLNKENVPFWVRASIAPIKNPDGKIISFIGVEEDITFEKFARQEIERKESLLSATLAEVPVIIFVLDSAGKFTFIKGSGLDLLGFFNQEELIGKHLSDLFGENSELEEDLKKVMKNKSHTSLRFANGFVFEIHYSAMAVEGDNASATIGLAINITDYYNAEQTIRESESKIRALLAAIPDYIFEANRDKIVVNYQQPAVAPISLQPSDVLGKRTNEIFPNIYPGIDECLEKVFETGESRMRIFDFHYDGRHRYFEARFVLKDQERVLAIVREVTDQMLAENELVKAKEIAERSDRLKSEFLAHMSHEIRTPVNTIMNFTSLMEEELYDKLSDELKDGFGVIRDGGMRLIRTIDLILNMSQIQTGTYSPVFKEIDLDKTVLPSLVQEFKYRAKRKNLDLVYINKSDSSKVFADDYTIGQIFANLIDNALKYTKQGKIEVLLNNRDGVVTVEVADTGIGISGEYLPHLFSPFTQEEMGYTRRFDGTGLGLALVKKYVEINNAVIRVESEKDKGTRFIVEFRVNGAQA